MKTNKNIEKYFEVLDSKQNFNLSESPVIQKKGFLYEFNYITLEEHGVNVVHATDILNDFDDSIPVPGSRGFDIFVHFTGIPAEIERGYYSSSENLKYFKIIIGLSKKMSLTDVNVWVLETLSLSNSPLCRAMLLNKRIIKNRNGVSVPEYLDKTNEFLRIEHPHYTVKQIMYTISDDNV